MVVRVVHLLAVIAFLFTSGCMNCERYIEHPTITSSTGQTICARHHIPLITLAGWQENRAVIYHSLYMQAVVETCNPNFIMPNESLHRSTRYSIPTRVSYCPLCEKAVSANRARPDATRPPSWWREFITGVHVNKT
jgi:hypothetical protein